MSSRGNRQLSGRFSALSRLRFSRTSIIEWSRTFSGRFELCGAFMRLSACQTQRGGRRAARQTSLGENDRQFLLANPNWLTLGLCGPSAPDAGTWRLARRLKFRCSDSKTVSRWTLSQNGFDGIGTGEGPSSPSAFAEATGATGKLRRGETSGLIRSFRKWDGEIPTTGRISDHRFCPVRVTRCEPVDKRSFASVA